MTFLLFLLLILPALVAILAPFFRRWIPPLPSDTDIRRGDLETERSSLYAALRELELDFHAGKFSPADYAALRAEYEARGVTLLKQLDSLTRDALAVSSPEPRPPHTSFRRQHPALLTTAAVGLVLLGVLGGYGLFRFTAETTTPSLERNLTDIPALLELGRLSLQREEIPRAIALYRKVLESDPHNAEALSSLGLILTMAGHTDVALATLDRALATDPIHPLALWAKGLALYQGKRDYRQAISVWERLLETHPSLEDAPQVREWIQRARAAEGSPAALSSATIEGTVSIATPLREKIPPDAVLFIIARRGEGPPLAVRKVTRPSFPLRYSLGSGDVMLPGASLTGEVSLTARLKKSGVPGSPEPGDMEGKVPVPVRVGSRQADILIDTLH